MRNGIQPAPIRGEEVTAIIDSAHVERLRHAGYVIVPLRPTDEMKVVGAPNCYIVPHGDWETALHDAEGCYRAMIELGCL
jgi:hypothetical protein